MQSEHSKRVLCFGAHPDDIEIGCGGTIAKLVDEGHEVEYMILTSGEAGHLSIPPKELAVLREKEAVAAAKAIGVGQVKFLGCEDSLTQVARSVKLQIIKKIRVFKPSVIFVHASTDLFSDHKIVSELVRGAVKLASGPWFAEVREQPWEVEAVYGYEVWEPLHNYQMAVDVSSTFSSKLKALAEFRSQIEHVDYLQAVEGLASYRGALSGKGRYVEVFEVLKTQFM